MHKTLKTAFLIFTSFSLLELGGSMEIQGTFKKASLSADSRSRVLS